MGESGVSTEPFSSKHEAEVSESRNLLKDSAQRNWMRTALRWRRRGRHHGWLRLSLFSLLLLTLQDAAVCGKWTPDMRVPPTPTPPKSAWQRRRFGSSDDDSSADLPNRAALTDSDMTDRNDDAEEDEWNRALESARRGDPMVMDTPLRKEAHRRGFHGKATEARPEVHKARRKTVSAEPTIRKLQFDSPDDTHQTPLHDSSTKRTVGPQSPQSPLPNAAEDDTAAHTHESAEHTPMPSSSMRTPERVNAFATSPRSPLPPGSAGVGGMTRRLSHATSFTRDFFDLVEIGAGEHGKVYQCVRRMDLWPYAVKVLQRGVAGPRDRERVLQEIYALASQGENPHAVRYFNAWEEKDVVYIQTELCQRTVAEEWQRARPLSEQRVWETLAQAACGLHYMHMQGVAHLDVKPSNMYVSMSGLVKLGDFGHATEATRGAVDGVAAGDRRYVSREVLEGDEEADLCKADMFSLGASLLELLGASPLPQSGPAYHAIRDGALPAVDGEVSPLLLGILSQLIHPSPISRPSAAEIVDMPAVAKFLSLRTKSVLHARSPSCQDRRLQSSLDKALQWGKEQEDRALALEAEVARLRKHLARPQGRQ